MEITTRQITLLQMSLTFLYDEVAKTSTPEMKQEIMELSKIIQDEAIKVK
jgi:hypothetical protein